MLIDTNILIDIQRGHPQALEWFVSLTTLPGVPAVVAMELVQDAQNAVQVAQVMAMIQPFPAAYLTPTDQHVAMQLFATLHLSTGIGLIDCLIAAMALGQNTELATFNQKHFQHIPHLKMVQPYSK